MKNVEAKPKNGFLRHSTLDITSKLNPEKFKLKVDENVRNDFVTRVPEALNNNKFGVNPRYFENFKKECLRAKKNYELEILKDNKKQEVLNRIVRFCDKSGHKLLHSKKVLEVY